MKTKTTPLMTKGEWEFVKYGIPGSIVSIGTTVLIYYGVYLLIRWVFL